MAAAAPRMRPRASGRGRPAPGPSVATRVLGSWQEPNTWTVGILLATGVVILARHPIAHALGTEVESPAATVSTAAPATHPRSAPAVPSLAAPAIAVPTHAPRDPFHALVAVGAAAVAPAAGATAQAAAPAVPAAPTAPAAPTTPVVGPTCTSTHRVQSGESLWSIAATATRSTDAKRVTLAWHRVYDANRTVIGSDPSALLVGTRLCLPARI